VATKLQSLVFGKAHFTAKSAKAWARAHGFVAAKIDITPNTIRLRQFAPSLCARSGGMVSLRPGVQGYVCVPEAGALGSLEAVNGGSAPLTAREEADIGRANVWFMDWECDGWGPLPPAVERVMKASQGRRYTPTEARVILRSFYETAPGNF